MNQKRKPPNRTRKHRLTVSLNDYEYKVFKSKQSITGHTQEEFIRDMLMGVEIIEKPPAEYTKILKELRRMGSNVYQILQKELQTKFIDVVMLQDIYENINDMDKVFRRAFSRTPHQKWRA